MDEKKARHVADLLAGTEGHLSFGPCAPRCGQHDVPVPGATGSVAVHDAHFVVTNHRSDVPLIVRNLDRPAECFRISTEQGPVTLPFKRAEVAGTHGWVLKIANAQPSEVEPTCDDDQLRVAWGLDPDSIAHSIMYMLTRHVIDGTEKAPPSTREIADEHLITPDTVRDHYARLLKLLGAEDFEDPRTGDGRREALINYARNHVYVRP